MLRGTGPRFKKPDGYYPVPIFSKKSQPYPVPIRTRFLPVPGSYSYPVPICTRYVTVGTDSYVDQTVVPGSLVYGNSLNANLTVGTGSFMTVGTGYTINNTLFFFTTHLLLLSISSPSLQISNGFQEL